jgi:hypothetical protein
MASAVRRKQAWQTAEILILRHQLAILQRHQPRRPRLNWADRALLATLLGLIPKARRRGLRMLVTPDTILRTARSSAAARPSGPCAGRPAGRPLAGTSAPWSSGWPARIPNGLPHDPAGQSLAGEDAAPLAVAGAVLQWLLRLAVAPASTR